MNINISTAAVSKDSAARDVVRGIAALLGSAIAAQGMNADGKVTNVARHGDDIAVRVEIAISIPGAATGMLPDAPL